VSTYKILKDRLPEHIRKPEIANVAGISDQKWASYHVFDAASSSFIGGKNRGRLPFVEVIRVDQPYDQKDAGGGWMDTEMQIVINVGDRFGNGEESTVEELAHSIAENILQEVRNDHYFEKPANTQQDKIGQLTGGPYGFQLILSMTIRHTYNKNNFSNRG
jgi:hypothetical protein